MDLFDEPLKTNEKVLPMYARLRPQTLEDFKGQKATLQIIELIKQDKLPSIILWGPPGTGKTTFAHIIKNITKKKFISLSAVLSGVKELKEVVERSKSLFGQTILFIDEIHRFNKAQQDAILPHIENGTFIFIGATTENPSFEIIPALLSRCKVVKFEALQANDLLVILNRIIKEEKITGEIDPKVLEKISKISEGDARFAINLFELALNNSNGKYIDENLISELVKSSQIKYDRVGDYHYDNISAFIKSMRGSDPDASIYYLAKMIEGGEDPKFILRRMIIFASEDISNADPKALEVAVSAFNAAHIVGMPEARIILAQAATYLATAPKSNASYLAIEKALVDIRDGKVYPPPLHIRNAPTKLMKDEGYSKGYKYPHDFENHYVAENYLPSELSGTIYYEPTEMGYEKIISERLKYFQKLKNK